MRKRGKNLGGIRGKGYTFVAWSPPRGKGTFLKLSDKHDLGKTHLSILSRETSLGRLGGQAFVA